MHKETKQFFTLYNTLDDKKVYLEKEVRTFVKSDEQPPVLLTLGSSNELGVWDAFSFSRRSAWCMPSAGMQNRKCKVPWSSPCLGWSEAGGQLSYSAWETCLVKRSIVGAQEVHMEGFWSWWNIRVLKEGNQLNEMGMVDLSSFTWGNVCLIISSRQRHELKGSSMCERGFTWHWQPLSITVRQIHS